MTVKNRQLVPILTLVMVLPLLGAPACAAQESTVEGAAGEAASGPPAEPIPVQAPSGFRSIRLGMELDRVKQLLIEDPLFDYRGDPDISFLPLPPQTLIETAGSSFIRRAYFQFEEDLLYIIILSLDPDRLDYYTLYSTLSGKYGEPVRLDPTEAVWLFEGLRLSLERPLNVKYIDSTVFEALQEEGQVQQDLWEISKDNFLQQF